MTEFFYRSGAPVPEKLVSQIVIGKQGTSGTLVTSGPCSRCGGQGGAESWRYTGYTCYRCGGHNSMHFERITNKVYVAEKLAKLQAAADKKAAKKAAEAKAKADVARQEFIAWAKAGGYGPVIGKILTEARKGAYSEFFASLESRIDRFYPLSEKQIEAATKVFESRKVREEQNAASEYVGVEKERIEFEGTLEFTKIFETFYGRSELHKFRSAEGNVFVWFKSGCSSVQKGDRVKVKGTVKKHEAYQGVKQTVLSRCKIEKVEMAA